MISLICYVLAALLALLALLGVAMGSINMGLLVLFFIACGLAFGAAGIAGPVIRRG
ncbi:MAG TPA: hypothetical protein VJ140_13980 [Actinomycetota bacterium]|nr:hypothetical protein [Actinomycetota bacterium]